MRTIVVVNDAGSADVVLTGSATMRLVGHCALNARSRFRMGRTEAVFDAKMVVEVDDSQGRILWSGRLKPRFWGSQYVSDNVVNLAARRVADVLRQKQ